MSGTALITGRDSNDKVRDVPVLCSEPSGLVTASLKDAILCSGHRFSTEVDVTLPSEGTIYVLGITGNKIIEMYARGAFARTEGVAGIDFKIELYEGVTTTTAIGNETTFNDNRTSDNEANFAIHSSPVTPTGGTKLPRTAEVATENKVISIAVTTDGEYIMKPNTKYSLKITNNISSEVLITLKWIWDEKELVV